MSTVTSGNAIRLSMGRAPTWSWLPESEIEPDCMTQIRNISDLPCAVHVAVMPDAHTGFGMPIGTVLATSDAVVPYAVGVDIGCGMIAVKTSLPATLDRDAVREALLGIFARVPVGQPTKRERNAGSFQARQDSGALREWFASAEERGWKADEVKQLRERADRQTGTLGGGNHFIELQTDGANVWLMLHTGSRAFGHAVCTRYHRLALAACERWHTPLPDRDLAFLPLETTEGHDYMADMAFALRFAEESRTRIEAASLEALRAAAGPFEILSRVDTHHNFAAAERHMGRQVIVHRKGAVLTVDRTGRLDVTIPGSMETGSYIGKGLANALSLNTCAHGAGRRLGRKAVRRANEGVRIAVEMEARGLILVTPQDTDPLDEAGRAYKDIESVMARQADLVEPVVKLAPLGTVKG